KYGSPRSSRGGMNRARALFQKVSLGNSSFHHVCQRARVLRETSKSPLSSLKPMGVGPWRMAVRRMTITFRYTFGPRKRTEGGVPRRRQPSALQEKLNRRRYSGGKSVGPPRGFRGKSPEWSASPQDGQPLTRTSSARSRSA